MACKCSVVTKYTVNTQLYRVHKKWLRRRWWRCERKTTTGAPTTRRRYSGSTKKKVSHRQTQLHFNTTMKFNFNSRKSQAPFLNTTNSTVGRASLYPSAHQDLGESRNWLSCPCQSFNSTVYIKYKKISLMTKPYNDPQDPNTQVNY